MTRLTDGELAEALATLPGWEEEAGAITKEFVFRTFRQAMAFVNTVAAIAQESRHHPDILIRYNKVRLTLTTHDEGGISDKDLAFARAVESREG